MRNWAYGSRTVFYSHMCSAFFSSKQFIGEPRYWFWSALKIQFKTQQKKILFQFFFYSHLYTEQTIQVMCVTRNWKYWRILWLKETLKILWKNSGKGREAVVCPQTFSHTVTCKVCLTASNTLFDADAFVPLNHWILSDFWRVRFLVVSPH